MSNLLNSVRFPLYHVEASSNLYRLDSLAALERIELRDIEDDQIYDSLFRRVVVKDDILNPGHYRLSVDGTLTSAESAQRFESLCRELYADTFGETQEYDPERDLLAIIEDLVTLTPGYESSSPSFESRWLSRFRKHINSP